MIATTIKLDGPILKDLKGLKQADQSLTSLVRDLLHSEIHRRKMAQVAEEYTAFLRKNKEENEEMQVWASLPLDSDLTMPTGKIRK